MSKKVIAKFHRLKEAKSVDDILDYMVFKAPKKTVDAAVFDHLLLLFFSTLPDFEKRNDFTEEELEKFKTSLPWKDLGLDGAQTSFKHKTYRSLNRILDELVQEMSEDKKKEIARDHIKQFWFEKHFGGDLEKFRSAMKESFWSDPNQKDEDA